MAEYLNADSAPSAVAPDGSHVDILLARSGTTTARFIFPPRSVSVAVRHRTVTEVWYFLTGSGRFWSSGGPPDGVEVGPGSTLAIEPYETFQLRSTSDEDLSAFAVTIPGWPGEGEAERREGPWKPTLEPGPA